MITIQNQHMTVTVSEKGAELQSIRRADGTEYLWQGDPAFWNRHAPVLFPFCGRLIDGEFTYEGKTYPMGGHGFARESVFEAETVSDTAVTFLLRDSDATRAGYPFSFEFRVTFALDGDTLAVTYAVHNPAETPLYMSFGGHEGYACPEGIASYDLVLPEARTLETYMVNPVSTYISNTTAPAFENTDTLPLRDDLFVVDALIFKHPGLSSVCLRHRETGRGVKVGLDNAPYVLVWSVPGAPFVCIEPCWGIGVCEDGEKDLTRKEGVNRVEGGETFSRTHTITIR